jgi:hypothetical protein
MPVGTIDQAQIGYRRGNGATVLILADDVSFGLHSGRYRYNAPGLFRGQGGQPGSVSVERGRAIRLEPNGDDQIETRHWRVIVERGKAGDPWTF